MSFPFEPSKEDECVFPSLSAFLVPVELRETPALGTGQKGVFAMADIMRETKIWAWTTRVQSIHHTSLETYIEETFGHDREAIKVFLRQGFVLPSEDARAFFHSNPTDAGRFMNHSTEPNCGPEGALRDIHKGEELTMCYSFHGNPLWYREICHKYDVQTEAEIQDLAQAKVP